MSNYRRVRVSGGTYFFTVNLLERRRRLPQEEWRSERRIACRERGIWQRRYWEHLIRDDDDLRRHVDYIHYNPVRHGNASCAAEWPYSSFRRWVVAGVYPMDWAMRPSG